MPVIPLFMLIPEQARHRWAHEHEQRSVECCSIVLNWGINLEDELHRLATETTAAGFPGRQVHGVQPCRDAAGLAGEQVAEEEAWALRLLKHTKGHFRLFLLILVVILVIRCRGGGARKGLVRNHGIVIILIQGGDAEAAKFIGTGFHSRRRRGGRRWRREWSRAAAKCLLPCWFGAFGR